MNIKYPSFVPPGSGQISYNEYTFAKYTNHIGVYNHMDWVPPALPNSYYHPYYIHNINDGSLAQRDPVNASSMEMGIGAHIAAIAQYANAHNLGSPDKRVGVSYFKQIGVSGTSNWWTTADSLNSITVNSGVIADVIRTDRVIITSGYFTNKSQIVIPPTNTTLSLHFTGSSFVDRLKSKTNKWLFEYGDIYLEGSYIKLFNDTFTLDMTSGSLYCSDEISFSGGLSTRNLTLTEGIVSGVFDSYLRNTITDSNIITYDNSTGHTHDASGFSNAFQDEQIVGNTIFDNTYYYAVGSDYILELDSTSTNMTWTKKLEVPYSDRNTRVFKDELSPYFIPSKANIKAASINGLSLSVDIGASVINISDGRTYNIDGPALITDEFYYIDGNLFFVHTQVRLLTIYKFNGKIWDKYTYSLYKFGITSTFINSCVSCGEIFISVSLNTKNFGIIRFTSTSNFIPIAYYQSFGNIKQTLILDHHLVASFTTNNSVDVYIYNTNTSKSQILFSKLEPMNSMLSVYRNSLYLFIQAGNSKKYIPFNKSSSLSLDAIDGIIYTEKEIKVNGSINSKSIIKAMTKTSLYSDTQHIYDHLFLLEPGRVDDTSFEYTGDFKNTYINRYLYNNIISIAGTYNEMTCSVFYKDTYYFAHRGDVSIFTKKNDTLVNKPSSIGQKIIVKFLPLYNKLYALVQDFEQAYVDYTPDNLPASPEAKEITNPNSEVYSNIIPLLPVSKWSIPFTKLYYKNNNDWVEDTNYTKQYGLNIIDAVSYDNNIYLLAHDNTGSGILTARYSYADSNPSGVLLNFSGCLELKESFLTQPTTVTLSEFVSTSDGKFIIGSDLTYPTKTSPDLNGFHEFYLYNHPISPYVVHDSVELLYDSIEVSGIYAGKLLYENTKFYRTDNIGDQYSYRTLSVTFLKEELKRPIRKNMGYDTTIQTLPNDISNPTIKIPIVLDFPYSINPRSKDDKYYLRQRVDHKDSNRKNVHFITSVTHNKFIYLILQIGQSIRIYCVRDFSDYSYKTRDSVYGTTIYPSIKTVFGGTSYAGIKTGMNYMENLYIGGSPVGNTFFLDFVPCELSNTIMTELDLKYLIGENVDNIFALGDGDDIFIQKPQSKNYRNNKRFSTHSTMSVGSNLYMPLTVRVNHPTGRLYTFVLGFFNDGSVGLVDKENTPIQIMNRPTGRTQCLYNGGKYVISSIGIADGEDEYILYDNMYRNEVYEKIKAAVNPSDTYANLYNSFSRKKWIIGEYDIKITDNLNVRETY